MAGGSVEGGKHLSVTALFPHQTGNALFVRLMVKTMMVCMICEPQSSPTLVR